MTDKKAIDELSNQDQSIEDESDEVKVETGDGTFITYKRLPHRCSLYLSEVPNVEMNETLDEIEEVDLSDQEIITIEDEEDEHTSQEKKTSSISVEFF